MSMKCGKGVGIFLLVLALTGLGSGLSAQLTNASIRPKINSPFSRYGLGNPVEPYFIASAGMAGLSTAWQDIYHFNPVNPASLASLQSTAFETGMYAQYVSLQGRTAKDNQYGGNLRYLGLAFPLKNPINRALNQQNNDWGVGMGFDLSPMTQVGYDILAVVNDPELNRVTNVLKGIGGIYKLRWGNAIRYKNLSLGLNVGYLFGELTNSRLVTFDSLSFTLQTEFSDQFSARGWAVDGGLQYAYDFKKTNDAGERVSNGNRIILGLTASPAANFDTESNAYYRRFFGQGVSDTLVYENRAIGSGSLPPQFSFGVSYQKMNQLQLGAEFSRTGWSEYANSAKPEQLSNTWRLAAGLEYIPDYASYKNYWARARYRFGFFYGTDSRSLDGEQALHRAITMGVGMPIVLPRQQVSFMNTALELGKFGVPNVLEETYVKLSVGFTLNDNTWFFKRKFN
jgi:hypothetical protein